jgi:hypothetical protein
MKSTYQSKIDILSTLIFRILTGGCLLATAGFGAAENAGDPCRLQPGAILRVALPAGAAAKPRAGAVFEGRLDRPVYRENCRILSQGTGARVVVDRIEKSEKLFPFGWVKRAAGRRAQPPAVYLRTAELELPGNARVPLKARFLRVETQRHVEASKQRRVKAPHTRMLLLQIDEPARVPGAVAGPLPQDGTLVAGTRVRVDLDTALSSVQNHAGDVIRARVTEPVVVNGKTIVPEGASFEGLVAQSRRAPRLYRSGRLRLSFQSLRLSPSRMAEAPAALTAGYFGTAANLEPEGGLTGGALDRKRALLNAGVAYLTGKILDDSLEESAKAVMGAAVAGSAATAARYVGLTSGIVIFLLHRGRDVRLEPHTELELTFSRDVKIQTPSAAPQ